MHGREGGFSPAIFLSLEPEVVSAVSQFLELVKTAQDTCDPLRLGCLEAPWRVFSELGRGANLAAARGCIP